MTRRTLATLSLLTASGLALAGCAASGDAEGAGGGSDSLTIVTSTSVYADLVRGVVGDAADVTAIIDSATADPHSYEASAQDQLAVTKADLIVLNGGGYDYYMEQLVESGDAPEAITAVEFSHDYPGAEGEEEHDHDEEAEDGHEHHHLEGFNEHVWYDPHTMTHVVEAIAEKAGELAPDDAEAFQSNADDLIAELDGLETSLESVKDEHEGATVAFTEPVGAYLAADAGLEDVTAEGFAEAVEEEQDVPPATLLEATTALEGGDVDVLIVNPQTAGPATDAVEQAAETGGVPVVEFTETIPDGDTYVSWMQGNIDALADALA